MTELRDKKCIPCEGGVKPLGETDTAGLLKALDARWKVVMDGKKIEASFEFRNYFRTIAFVNAAAYVAIQEDHHPDIAFGYNKATVTFWTHAADGLTENDFICAAKLDALVAG
jgi:4a-hydroxytetrahydrobiopterin dehydratase